MIKFISKIFKKKSKRLFMPPSLDITSENQKIVKEIFKKWKAEKNKKMLFKKLYDVWDY